MLPGRSASPGIAIGTAVVVKRDPIVVTRRPVSNVDAELKRLEDATRTAKADLTKVYEHALKTLGAQEAAIFEAHLMMLEDPELVSQTQETIKNEKVNAEYAFKNVIDQFVQVFENMDNEYMRGRAADVRDIGHRVLGLLTGVQHVDLTRFEKPTVVVADELTPSELATMDLPRTAGFVTEQGGRTSHVAIMARTLEIPAVVGVNGVTKQIKSGDLIVFDGDIGEVHANPEEKILKHYKTLKEEFDSYKRELGKLVGQKSVTLDGHEVTLAANIGTTKDIESLKRNDAEGVGLFRTEFLYMNRNEMPSEEEQYQVYSKVIEACSPHLAVIRTLDIGGDKTLPYLPMAKEENPFLGNRAIRLCLENVDMFKIQLRALLRASVHGKLGIMFPMISCLEELLEAKKIVNETRVELEKSGKKVASEVQVGIMIEIPAAAVISDILAQHCDFFSIGTNDLIQYTCAVDRMNKNLEKLYSPYHPGVLRLVNQVIENGHKAGIWVGMCGEVAGKPDLVPLLLGMGLDEFSMSPPSVLAIRKLVRAHSFKDLKKEVAAVLALPTSDAVQHRLQELLEKA